MLYNYNVFYKDFYRASSSSKQIFATKGVRVCASNIIPLVMPCFTSITILRIDNEPNNDDGDAPIERQT